MLDEAGDAVGEAVLVALVVELDVEVVARPGLEDEVADAYLIGDIALDHCQCLRVLCVLLGDFVLHRLLLHHVLLLGLVLLVHLLHPHRVNRIEIDHLLGLQLPSLVRFLLRLLGGVGVVVFGLPLGHSLGVQQLNYAIDSVQLHNFKL